MQQPIQVTFRNLAHSESLKRLILDEAEGLERYFERIISCHVVVEVPHQHHHKGNHYRIQIELNVPGKTLLATKNSSQHFSDEDCYLAIRESFHEIRRQLQDFVQARRGFTRRPHIV